MASRIKGITIEINGDTTKLSQALRETDTQLTTVQKNLRDVERLLKLDPPIQSCLPRSSGFWRSSPPSRRIGWRRWRMLRIISTALSVRASWMISIWSWI